MGRTATEAQRARARARQRMVELERERLERQRRLETAVTAVYVAIDKRTAAHQAACSAEDELAAALRAVLDEGTDVDQAAVLCELTRSEIRQLTRRRANGSVPDDSHTDA